MEKANTQYTDLIGTAAGDWHGSQVDLRALARELGIDTDMYFPVALDLYGLPLEIERVYGVAVSKLTSNAFTAVQAHLRENPHDIEELKFKGQVDIANFLKRLQVNLRSKDLDELPMIR